MVCSSSRFFRRSSRISADSALLTPGAFPSSTSACRIHLRSVSALIPSRPETAGAMMQAHEQTAADIKAQIADGLERIGIRASFVRRRGNPYLELVRVAQELRVDAIVVGASTQAGHRLVGSLAGRLVRDAKWPVTVVP